MYRLIVDRGVVNDYIKVLAPNAGLNPETINPAFYHILRHHSRPLIDSIFGDAVPPVRMIVTIRTDLSNEVLVPDDGKFYTDCTASYPNEHPLDDTVMLAGKKLVDKLFDCGEDIVEVIKRTTIYPLGASVLNDQVYVYVNVVIDHTLKTDPMFKIKGCHFESIADQTPEDALERDLLNHLAIVKGDKDNA